MTCPTCEKTHAENFAGILRWRIAEADPTSQITISTDTKNIDPNAYPFELISVQDEPRPQLLYG